MGYRVFMDIEALNSDDWVRREVMCAIENNINIIPIMLAGFEWPNPMPEGMEDLCMYQSLAPLPDVYFDMQMKKLQSYVKSKAHYQKRRRWLIGLSITAAIIALLLNGCIYGMGILSG